MKRFFYFSFLIVILGSLLLFKDEIALIVIKKIYENDASTYESNNYTRGKSFLIFQKLESFVPQNKKDLINIIYTFVDSGAEKFNFICPEEYVDCIEDMTNISEKNYEILHINNFVHPFNSYRKIFLEVNMLGKITLSAIKNYSDGEINYVNDQIDIIESNIIKENMDTRQKIKAFHDYVINNSKYDVDNIDENNNSIDPYNISHKATGILLNKVALCGGYTDIMAIYLNRLNLENYKIVSDNHIWNLVKLDDKWYHIDVTWDDPVIENKDTLLDDFFLISTKELLELDEKEHTFDTDIYIEALKPH